MEEKNIEDVNFNHFSLIYESNVLPNHVDDAINVPPNKKTNKSFLFLTCCFFKCCVYSKHLECLFFQLVVVYLCAIFDRSKY